MTADSPKWTPIVAIAISVLALFVSGAAALQSVYQFYGLSTPGDVERASHQAKPYFETMSTPSLDSYAQMAGFAQPDSPAYTYATIMYETWLAYKHETGKDAPPKVTIKAVDSRIDACWPIVKPAKKPECDHMTGFVFDAQSGLLSDFSVNGVPIRGRTFAQQPWNKNTCLWTRVDGAYRHLAGATGAAPYLTVAINVHNNCGDPVQISKAGLVYWDTDTKFVPEFEHWGKFEYASVQEAVLIGDFRKSEIGGQVDLSFRIRGNRHSYDSWASLQG